MSKPRILIQSHLVGGSKIVVGGTFFTGRNALQTGTGNSIFVRNKNNELVRLPLFFRSGFCPR